MPTPRPMESGCGAVPKSPLFCLGIRAACSVHAAGGKRGLLVAENSSIAKGQGSPGSETTMANPTTFCPTASAGPSEAVRIILAGHTGYLSPRIAPVIETLNELREILPNTDVDCLGEITSIVPWFTNVVGEQGIEEPRWRIINGRPDFNLPTGDWFAFPAGLAGHVHRDLEQLGHHVDVLYCFAPTHTQLAVNRDSLNGTVGNEFQLLSRILEQPRGLIRTRRKVQLSDPTTLIARLFPNARIAVAVATVEQANRFHGEIGRRLGEPIGIIHSQSRHNRGSCSVVTFRVLDAMAFDSVDIIIIPNAVEAIASVPLRALARLGTQRVYGFLRANNGLNGADRLILQAFIGPEIYQAAADDNEAVVSVMMCASPGSGSRDVGHHNEHVRKRLIWRNAGRNRFIADLAYACAAGDFDRCRQLGLRELGTAACIMSNDAGVTRIVILVEGTEHARSLQQLIPEATVIEKDPDRPGTRSTEPTRPRSGVRITIVTAVAAELDQWPSEVVIRASGDVCTRCSQLLPRLCVPEDGNNQQLLIDVSDGAGEQATTEQNRRRSLYAANGWAVFG